MECTQRLECTQELYSSQSERLYPEQIGFLGICGKKYAVNKGPNKIGRDPQTCNIVLNLNSVSRQHAVINILNKKDFMLMDLDSANKTKLLGKTLAPYIPQPVRNGDTVQFGDVFGIFRLLEEEDDLPMTQAIDIPDTPVPTKHISRVNAITTVPESPDVSDRDDSFIVPSQPKEQQFHSPKTRNYIKPGKTISIQPLGTNKIDNIYWSSSKKSTSLNLDDSNNSLNDIPSVKLNDKKNRLANYVHESEAPEICPAQEANNESTDSIYTANTQIPENENAASIHSADTQLPDAKRSPSIHSMETQIPCGTSPSIHTLDTQLPSGFSPLSSRTLDLQIPSDYLPDVCKINKQQEMQFDLCAKKDIDIHNAETQVFPAEKENIPIIPQNINVLGSSAKSNHKLNMSNEEVLFDEVDNQLIRESLESQAILSEDIDLPINKLVESEMDALSQITKPKSAKRNMRIKSDSSTDCEDFDILPTQKILEEKPNDDDETDCEELIELKSDISKPNDAVLRKSAEILEDLPTQVIIVDKGLSLTSKNEIDLEDMPTQVLDIDKQGEIGHKDTSNIDFEDLPTQVLEEDIPTKSQHFSKEEANNPFKIPFTSPLKAKKKDAVKTPKNKPMSDVSKTISCNGDDGRYYQDTQDIYDDLCTQKIDCVEVNNIDKVSMNLLETTKEKSLNVVLDTSISVDAEEKVNDFVSNLSSQEVRNMIGVDPQVTPITKFPSDGSIASTASSSDGEITPKKPRTMFMDSDLPDSQEIKTTVSLSIRPMITESSSESDTENNSEDQCTPILFRKKKKSKGDAKMDLTKKFDVSILPTRVITRVRKRTAWLQDQESVKASGNILKSKFFTEQECDIDKEIITENINRLKSKNEKSKSVKSTTDLNKHKKQVAPINNSSEMEAEKVIKKEPKPVQNEDMGSKTQLLIPIDITNKTINSTVESKDKTQSMNKGAQVGCLPVNLPESDKKEHNLRKKIEEDERERLETNLVKVRGSNKNETRRKREPKTAQKESTVSNIQPSINDNGTNPSLNSTVEVKDKPRLSNKSQQIEGFDVTESNETYRRTRRTRNTNHHQASEQDSRQTKDSQTEKPIKRKYTRKQEPKKKAEADKEQSSSPEKEIRRSKRQRTVKEKESEKVPKSILKKSSMVSHEESAVYNLSSGSNSDSCRTFKRSALNDGEMPSPKRTRSVVANNTISLRATPARLAKTQHVLFTAFPFGQVKVKLEKMGAVVVTDIMKSTMILTQQIKRTFKLLCAVGLGKPIVGPSWVQACADTNMIVDPWLYLMKDEAAEKRFRFSLERTLTGKRNFLRGYNVSSTPSVMPEAHEMKLIVECSGGTWKEGGPQWICVSIPDDKSLWPSLRSRGATVVSTEFILGGVLRQKVEIDANKYKI